MNTIFVCLHIYVTCGWFCHYCEGTNHGTTCEHPVVSCPDNQTIFSTFCSILCPSYYAQKGANSITCTAAGTWSTTVGTYCRRINDPPSQVIRTFVSCALLNIFVKLCIFVFQIILSGSHSVPENSIKRTLVGRLSSVDTSPRDLHNYSLISGGEGKFVLFDDELYTDFVFDYETMTTRYWRSQLIDLSLWNLTQEMSFCVSIDMT